MFQFMFVWSLALSDDSLGYSWKCKNCRFWIVINYILEKKKKKSAAI